jgi:hypothetical protein
MFETECALSNPVRDIRRRLRKHPSLGARRDHNPVALYQRGFGNRPGSVLLRNRNGSESESENERLDKILFHIASFVMRTSAGLH